jgi:2-oxoglutarate ferredoxin oxidoreductase subunit beta
MSKRNEEYDFKWCPGCGDFGVVRGIELALAQRVNNLKEPIENTVLVAGIGCSGNLVHLQEGPQPFGIHGIHGRTLPIAYGVKASRPELNVLIMDNGIYGLTKGQASPTTAFGEITPTTPYGKLEDALRPLDLYLSLGVSFVASALSSRPRDLANVVEQAMEHPGFAIVHVQSPCTTYNDTYEALKGNPEKGIEPAAFPVPDNHDASNRDAAVALVNGKGIPVGLIYRNPDSKPMHDRLTEARARVKVRTRDVEQLLTGMHI